MTFHILTLFPQTFDGFLTQSIIKRAIGKKLVKFDLINPRDFATDKHKTVDDKPYGGGKGMILKVEIVKKALDSIKPKPYTILLSASGKKYTQRTAQELSKKKQITLICGHYEGTDARIEKFADTVLSVGDFVTTGGEIAAMAICDSTTRLLKNVITEGSTIEESFQNNLLEYPQYTRPENFKGLKVPRVLLAGDHKKIHDWRMKEAKKRTKKFRPDLLSK